MGEKHFFAVHTFVSDEARRKVLTPPEKKNPPEKRSTEKEWVDGLHGKYAKCMQTWIGNEEFSIVIGLQQVNKMCTDNLMNLALETSF